MPLTNLLLIRQLFFDLLVLALVLLPVVVLAHRVRQGMLRRHAWQVADGCEPAALPEVERLLRVIGAAPSDSRDGELLPRLAALRDHLSRP